MAVTAEDAVLLSAHTVDGNVPVNYAGVDAWVVEWPGTAFPSQYSSLTGLLGTYAAAAPDAAGRVVIATASVSPDYRETFSFRRYLSDGSIDPTLDAGTGPNADILSIASLGSGKAIVLGTFVTFNNQPCFRLARLLERNSAEHSPALVAVTPESAIAAEGDTSMLTAVASGSGPYQFAWINNAANDGAILSTASTLAVTTSGRYSVTITTGAGVVLSREILVRFNPAPPKFLRQPASESVETGRTAVFIAAATGSTPISYRWFFNGSPLNSATGATLSIPSITAANAGSYTVVATNSLGSVTSQAVRLTVDDTSHLANLATRGFVGIGENILITGLVVTGPGAKTVLLRGIGPSLTGFGVAGALSNPKLVLFDSTGGKVAENDDWGGGSSFVNAFAQAGAFPLSANSLDAALLRTLDPGVYSVQLSGVGGATGVGLVECYEFDQQPSRLINLSSRVLVGTDVSVAIPGLVVAGPVPRKLLIRAVGPTLSTFGVQNPLTDPALTLIGPGGSTIATNDNWGSAANAAEVVAISASIGAFALPSGSKDAAVLVTLQPGGYSALVSGVNNTSGVALVEVYEVP